MLASDPECSPLPTPPGPPSYARLKNYTEDAMRPDTAAPQFCGSAFRAPFRQAALAGLRSPLLLRIRAALAARIREYWTFN